MSIVARCNCGQEMRVLDEDLGKPVECPGCRRRVIVQPGSAVAVPVPPPAAPPTGPVSTADYAASVRPHRGAWILAFGILSFVAPCAGLIFGIVAWVMANNDLRQMAKGTMDPGGEALTKAGKILGIVGIALNALGIVFGCFGTLLGGCLSLSLPH